MYFGNKSRLYFFLNINFLKIDLGNKKYVSKKMEKKKPRELEIFVLFIYENGKQIRLSHFWSEADALKAFDDIVRYWVPAYGDWKIEVEIQKGVWSTKYEKLNYVIKSFHN